MWYSTPQSDLDGQYLLSKLGDRFIVKIINEYLQKLILTSWRGSAILSQLQAAIHGYYQVILVSEYPTKKG